MSEVLYISVKFTAKDGSKEELKNRLIEMVDITVKEDGCLFYDLHVDRDDDSVFYYFEGWANKELHAKHAEAPHVAALFADLPRLTVDGARLDFMHKIAPVKN
jgi:quinol monooxygenase YgiN